MTAGERKPERLEALDAWRGLCALLVVLEHFNVQNVLHTNELVHHSYRFVDFFFVLSGFVISHAYADRLHRGGSETRGFLIRRIGRLWPLHLVVLTSFVLFEVAIFVASKAHISVGKAAFTERDTLASLPANVFLVQAWGILDHSTWNVPAWSISTEILAYTVFALMCAWVSRGWLIVLAAIVLLGSVVVIVLVAPAGMASTYDWGVFRCLFGFMTGVLTRELWRRWPIRGGTAVEIAIVIAVFTAVTLLPLDGPALLVTPIFALAVWIFASEDGTLSRLMTWSAPQALGRWSYSIYMVHALIVLVILAVATIATKYGVHVFARVNDIATLVGPVWLTTAITLGYLAIVLVIARFTYLRIELPGQRLFARLVKPTT